MKSKKDTLTELKKELLRIGTTNREKYDFLEKKGVFQVGCFCPSGVCVATEPNLTLSISGH